MTEQSSTIKLLIEYKGLITFLSGWGMGILSNFLMKIIEDKKNKGDLTKGLQSELSENKITLTCTAYNCLIKRGNFDRELIKWALNNLSEYDGLSIPDNLLETLNKLNDANEKDFKALSEYIMQDKGLFTVSGVHSPFLDKVILNIHLFNREIQSLVFEIKKQINFYNEEAERLKFYFRLTFNNISEANHAIVNVNMETSYSSIARIARLIVNKTNLLEHKLNRKTKNQKVL